MKNKRRQFNPILYNYLMEHGMEHNSKEWVTIINEKFDENFTLKQMQDYFLRHQIPHIYEAPKKRNNKNAHVIGSERIKADGMHQVKVAEHKWEYKQRYIYEKYHNVELPDDVYVVFLDQNRDNFDISNLKAVKRNICSYMANEGTFSKDKECTELGIISAKLHLKIKNYK